MLHRSKRSVTLALATLGLVATGAGDVPSRAQVVVDERPNVVIVVTDDQRVGTMAIMRHAHRWLETGGVTFTHAYATNPLCCPSRASIFSGQYSHNNGVETNSDARNLDTTTTLQARLKQAGYATGFAGKYLNSWPVNEPPPFFDRWAMRRAGTTFFEADWNIQGRVVHKKVYDSVMVQRHALRMMDRFERNDEQPWFLYLAPIAPHIPASPQPKYADARVPPWQNTPAMHEDDISDKPQFIQESPVRIGAGVKRLILKQNRSLLSVDVMLHQVMARLGELGERRDTLVIFLSDNGYLWRDHGLTGKTLPYIPSIQIPFLMRWPGRLSPGTVDERIVANIDVAPTVLDAAGVEIVNEMDGRSLLDPAWDRDRLLLEGRHPRNPLWDALLTDAYEYIEWRDPDGPGIAVEYYDLIADPWQLRNLFGDQDASNDPSIGPLMLQLEQDRGCKGIEQEPGGPPPCP